MVNKLDKSRFNADLRLPPNNFTQNLQKYQGTMITALMAGLLPGCFLLPTNRDIPLTPNVTPHEIVNNINLFKNSTITMKGRPIQQVGIASFLVIDRQRFNIFGNKRILVINGTGQPFKLPNNPNTVIQVTGDVQRFSLPDIERKYNLQLQREYYTGYENQPVIVARSLGLSVLPGEVTRNPDELYGEVVTATGRVEDLIRPTGFRLKETQFLGGAELLVLYEGRVLPVNNGDLVAVTGVVQPFIASKLDREYRLNWDFNQKKDLALRYSNQPVLIAQKLSFVTDR
ncbi:MAG: hypothetical protein VKL59_08725 [Nostocaceae cyanobacterium]|nr:hypothetical protein [Nostocaceae cyanobacterium]